ncbi:uncharacterized protein BcabD6B2_13960 [Babesia caballi]|uniref:50S ribosomal protein L35 n=1 Tax=Babesia caballi TaxID=5871 RepID=A0AAV4LSC5_BABCB|nr:hypothetical protein, conserved [Babesia caballi]
MHLFLRSLRNLSIYRHSVSATVLDAFTHRQPKVTQGHCGFLPDSPYHSSQPWLPLRSDRRTYNPARNIDWVGVKRRWRSKQLFMKKRKLKNHPRVALRFRLTRFGWERLQQGRRGKKLHLSGQQRRNKKRIRFVSRHDLVKLARQMPGHRLRVRDPPLNNNPNIQRLRRTINNYFA